MLQDWEGSPFGNNRDTVSRLPLRTPTARVIVRELTRRLPMGRSLAEMPSAA